MRTCTQRHKADLLCVLRKAMHRSSAYGRGFVAILGIGMSMVSSRPAAAQAAGGGTDPATMVNNICTFILGPFGQSLAVLGIVAIGVSWMFGRASLGLVAGVVGGIVIMFGASFLGKTLTGGA